MMPNNVVAVGGYRNKKPRSQEDRAQRRINGGVAVAALRRFSTMDSLGGETVEQNLRSHRVCGHSLMAVVLMLSFDHLLCLQHPSSFSVSQYDQLST